MPRFTETDIKEQQLLVEGLRKQLDDEELMLRFMERGRKMEVPRGPAILDGRVAGSSFASGTIDVGSIGVRPKKQEKPTLKEYMADVISRIAEDQEFSVTQLELILRDIGHAPEGKHARNRISVLVKHFVDEGLLTKTFKGKGAEPHLYTKNKSQAGLFSVAGKDAAP